MELKYALATLHQIAKVAHPSFKSLQTDDNDGDSIHFKVMSDGGTEDVKIADTIEKWLMKNHIFATRYRDRGFEIKDASLQNLVQMGKDSHYSQELLDMYSLEQ